MRRVKDFSIIASGQILQAIILIATTRVMTRLLSPAQMGRFSIIYAIIALFIALFISSVGSYIQRKILEWDTDGSVLHYAKRFLGYLFAVSLTSSFFILWVKNSGSYGIDISHGWSFVLAFGLLFFEQINSFFYNSINLFQKRLWFTLCYNLTFFCSLIIAPILVLTFARKAEFWILGQIFSHLLVLCLSGVLFFQTVKRPSSTPKRDLPRVFPMVKDVFLFAWPLSVASLILWGHSQAYRFLVEMTRGIEFVGFFTVGFNLGTKLIDRFEKLFLNFYDPIFYSEIASADIQQKAQGWNHYARAFLPAIIILCVFICSARYLLAQIFFSAEFQRLSAQAILWGGLAATLSTMRATYTKVGIAGLKMTGLLGPYLLGTIVTLSGIILFSKGDPYFNTGLALTMGALTMLVYLMIKMHKLLPVTFPLKEAGTAILYSLPLGIGLTMTQKVLSEPGIWLSVFILVLSSMYVLIIEMIFAKKYMFKGEISFRSLLSMMSPQHFPGQQGG